MQLLNIQDHKDLVQAVDAKELYGKLGLNPAHWSRWHGMNIEQNPFATDGLDFIAFTMMVNGREFPNYLLSIDFAKKLAMQVKTDKGEQVRDYFLACERQAKQPAFQIPQTLGEALQLAANQALQIEQDAPKVAHYNAVADRKTLLNATQVAQSVGLHSPQSLNTRLDKVSVYNKAVKRGRAFNGWFIEQGLGEMKQGKTGHMQPLFTTKGQIWVFELLGGVK